MGHEAIWIVEAVGAAGIDVEVDRRSNYRIFQREVCNNLRIFGVGKIHNQNGILASWMYNGFAIVVPQQLFVIADDHQRIGLSDELGYPWEL